MGKTQPAGVWDRGGLTLREQVTAGLGLYVLTAELLKDVILPEHAPLVEEVLNRIQKVVG